MSHFLIEFLERGLSDIVIVPRSDTEQSIGPQAEHVVARKGSGFVKAHASRGLTRKITEMEITETTYQELSAGKFIEDTPQHREAARPELEARKLRRQSREILDKVAPPCPDCKVKMVPKSNANCYFWGCSRFPKCRGFRGVRGRKREMFSIAAI